MPKVDRKIWANIITTIHLEVQNYPKAMNHFPVNRLYVGKEYLFLQEKSFFNFINNNC
jgi:hypothetical protein